MTRVTAMLALFAYAIAPAVAAAQVTTAPMTAPADPPPVRLFQNDPPSSTGEWISLKSADFWKPPLSGSELPRWTIGRTATVNGPGGLALSAGFSVRRGDPMPLYLSQPVLTQRIPGSSITGPGTYRTQWDVTFGASAPIGTVGRMKVNAFGDVIVPVTTPDSANSAAPFLSSRTIRFGIVAIF